jgi:hypothetical protein
LDLGCGYADLLWRCWAAGASEVWGLDQDIDIINRNARISAQMNVADPPVGFICTEIQSYMGLVPTSNPDVILCFSVLPYLSNIPRVLEWIYNHSHTALIECQLFGDGPGPEWLKTLGDLAALFRDVGWLHIQLLGSTYIPDRDKHRIIWMCENKELL